VCERKRLRKLHFRAVLWVLTREIEGARERVCVKELGLGLAVWHREKGAEDNMPLATMVGPGLGSGLALALMVCVFVCLCVCVCVCII
jgi:hypothetical protein